MTVGEFVAAVASVGVLGAIIWFWRQVTPPAHCPFCQSQSWFILGDTKQCRDCGRVFF